MNIKKFQGKNKDEALKQAQKELGDNVVILNEKKIKSKGFFSFLKGSIVELTVATQGDDEVKSAPNAGIVSAVSSVDKLRIQAEQKKSSDVLVTEKLDNIQSLLEEKLKKAEPAPVAAPKEEVLPAKVPVIPVKPVPADDEPGPEIMNFIKLLYNTMVDNDIREQYANQMIDDIVQNYRKDMTIEYILGHIYQKIVLKFGERALIEPAKEGPKVIYFIGPTGVGKTTTLAKIASQLYFKDKKKVAMFTMDTYRISASDQLKTYAKIMDAPMEILYTPEEMKEALKKYSTYNYILVDTAGHAVKNDDMCDKTNSFLHCLDDQAEKEVYLVLSATTKYKDLVNVTDFYSKMTDYRLIFTKLDETLAYGNLLNIRMHTGAPMSYITCGQNVPDDFEEFSVTDITKKLLLTDSEDFGIDDDSEDTE